ncbi:MAG: ABC transporter [Myxococcales bacterium]|nr:ABC transporter [Myxococcales bacterium]
MSNTATESLAPSPTRGASATAIATPRPPRASSMRPVITIARREMAATFDSPIAYIAGTVFLVVTGLLFFFGVSGADDFFAAREATLRPLFEYAPWVLAVILPAVTMRLLAEEKKAGTLELLVTLPVTDLQIVLGKLLGAVGFLAVALLLTGVFPLLVAMKGAPDLGAVAGGYLGLFLVGTAFLSLGLMTSTWTHNQIVAFIVGLLLCAFFWTATDALLKAVFDPVPSVLQLLNFQNQFSDFSKGVVDLRNVLYFVAVTAVGVAVSTYSLQSRQWK